MGHKLVNKTLVSSLILLMAIAFFSTCKKNPVGPQVPAAPDTTSHDFTWQTFTLGDGNSSVLNDVAIINDTLVYAVGDISLRDSTGKFEPQTHNFAMWNGNVWHLGRIAYKYQGDQLYFAIPWIFAVNAQDIWFGNSTHWNGLEYNNVDIATSIFYGKGTTKMWGNSNKRMYAVGNGGTCAFSQDGGMNWVGTTGGTTSDFRDIWGITDAITGFESVSAIASSPGETKVLSLSDVGVTYTLSWPLNDRLLGVWFCEASSIYVCGPGVWKHSSSGWQQMQGLPNTFYQSIRGTADNNIFTVSWNGVLANYNGASWRQFSEIPTDFSFYSVAVSKNMVVAVGFTGGMSVDKACAVIGTRTR